jgi:photosystem II stability/assembly factor-like uncharacterized protein
MRRFTFLYTIVLLLSTLIYPQVFNWEWQHPQPVGNNLNDITILPNGNYIAVGDYGVALLSTNAGASWVVTYIDSLGGNRSIYEAGFVDNNIGFACGLDGLLLKTTDGGATWTNLNSGSINDFWYIEMIDADTGYVCGSVTTLLKTTDGGSTWNPITISGTSTTLYKVHFLDAATGYMGTASATVGRLLKTTDYGNTWAPVAGYTAIGTTRGIFFFDADTGWVSNSNYQILKTTDGGSSFFEQVDFGTGTIYEIKFWDAFNGVAAGANGDVFFTTDGGTNWTTTNTGQLSNVYGLGISGFLGEGLLNETVVCGEGGAMAFSGDFGATWLQLSDLLTVESLREIHFVNLNVGYAVGGSTTFSDILKTTDGGANWTKLAFNGGYTIYSQYWVDENTGYAGRRGPDGIFKTTDGGATWATLNPGIGTSTSIWYEMVFFDADTGFASGSSGYLVKTTDGGVNWTSLNAGFGTSVIYDMWMFDSQNLLVIGSSGKIARTTDGGTSFTLLTTPFTTTLYSIYFENVDTGYVCGASGNIYKTTDAGITWITLATPGTNTLYDIIFSGAGGAGWVCGSAGAVWYTIDGGTNWLVANKFPSTALMYSVNIFGNRLWVAGNTGNILRGYSDPIIPVELISFSASVSGNVVSLNWQTATELNNSGFQLERKGYASTWKVIGFIQGAGTSTQINNYSFTDNNPERGINYYRLKQIDFDGTFEYSGIIKIELSIPDKFDLAQNYPNPFNPNTTIKYSIADQSVVSLVVFNALGEEVIRLVDKLQQPGNYTVDFDASSLSSGVYIYQLKAGKFAQSKKMLFLK